MTKVQKIGENFCPSVDVRGAIKRAERFVYDAGLTEDETERLLFETDAVESGGDDEVRRHRKALVLRIKKIMRRAARFASEDKLTAQLRSLVRDTEALKMASAPLKIPSAPTTKDTKMELDSGAEESDDASETHSDIKQSSEDESLSTIEEEKDEDSAVADGSPKRKTVEDDEDFKVFGDRKSEAQKEEGDESPRKKRRELQREAMTPPRRTWSPRFRQQVDPSTGNVHLTAHLPGVSRKDLSVELNREDRTLSVSAVSSSHGLFEKEFQISEDLDINRTEAELEDEVLHIVLAPARHRLAARKRPSYRPHNHYSADPFMNSFFRMPRVHDSYSARGFGFPMMGW
eukprot:CAMPEP_0184501818 /NCGR_PEP_ID=MMETSP0113_2-20130426/48652_1 /TAXON_ID=91329 /ORGANISM="Norrisiella sphaerica, Strain BC52" /LENGTH=344 /DNA_ID=CAMNT_0026890715 /DNA_START=123 /DNA_END=1157 /DNA_ORIENTATION=-